MRKFTDKETVWFCKGWEDGRAELISGTVYRCMDQEVHVYGVEYKKGKRNIQGDFPVGLLFKTRHEAARRYITKLEIRVRADQAALAYLNRYKTSPAQIAYEKKYPFIHPVTGERTEKDWDLPKDWGTW